MSVTAARGFTAAGVACGIKQTGALDLAIVAAARPVPAGAVFTVNQAAAAPVRLSRSHLEGRGTARAVVVNSGCANAATGAAGDAAAAAMAAEVADRVGCLTEDVLVCSTGTIGDPLPLDRALHGIDLAAATLDEHSGAGTSAAAAILTTDSVVKESLYRAEGFVVGGMAKGAGMIRPDMATMLAVITTDAAVDTAELDAALRRAVDESFHSLNVDGCASTNDTVIVLASGASGVSVDRTGLYPGLAAVCCDLAERIAADAEGASRVVTLEISGAIDDTTARSLGRAIADSALVRAAFHGGDPNWGRIVGAMGATALPFDPARVAIGFSGVPVAEAGVRRDHDAGALGTILEHGDFTVTVDLGDGPGRARVWTTDLTPDYVRFNSERS